MSDPNPVSVEEESLPINPSSKRPLSHYRKLPFFGEHKRSVSSIKFAPSRYTKEGQALCASASASSFLKVWDLKAELLDGGNDDQAAAPTALNHVTLGVGHSRGINEVCWNPYSPLIATASDDKTVRLWDAVTGDSLVEFRGHDNFVFSVDQHHCMVVSGSFDETVKLWDIRSGECVQTLPAHSDPVTAVSLNRDGTCVCSASHDGLIRIWDVATGECFKTIFAKGNPPVSSVVYAPNGKYLLAGTLDSTLRLWPVNRTGSHQCAKTYSCKSHVNTKYSIAAAFTSEGNIVVGSETGTAVVYDLQSRQVVQELTHEGAETVLAVSAHDALPLISTGGMADRKVEFWIRDEEQGAKKPKTIDMEK